MRRCARRALVCSELPSGVRSTAASATNRRRTTSSSVNVTSSGRSTIRDSRTAASSHLSPGPLSRCPQGFREPRGQPVDEPPQIPGPALPHCRRPRPHYRVAGGGGRVHTAREPPFSACCSRPKPRSTDLRRRGVTLQLRRKLVDAFARSRSGQRALRCVRRSASRPVAVPESLLMGSWRTGRVSGSAWWRQRP